MFANTFRRTSSACLRRLCRSTWQQQQQHQRGIAVKSVFKGSCRSSNTIALAKAHLHIVAPLFQINSTIAAPPFTGADEGDEVPNDNSSAALEFESRHPNIELVDADEVKKGLSLSNSDKCPFLSSVSDRIKTDPNLREAIHFNTPESGKVLKDAIDKTMCNVLRSLQDQKRYREFKYFQRRVGQHPRVVHEIANGSTGEKIKREAVTWCSNDYLNMGHHPVVLQAMNTALMEQGAGAGGTRNISGSNMIHSALEAELANLCHLDAALIFSSCYNANLGVMEGLASAFEGEGVMVFSDEENHASLVQGIRNSRLPKKIFKHNDVDHLEELLANTPQDVTKVVVFESVYSMSGTLAPVDQILSLCEEYGAISLIDEVHAIGLYGKEGAGVLDMIGQLGRADLVTGTLGKAFGVSGGFVAGSASLIDVIRSTSSSFIFTTSMPPVVAAGALASVRHVRACSDERQCMAEKSAKMKERMKALHLPLMSDATHIMPLLVGEGSLCKRLSEELLERGIYIQPINYPSVPKGEELLRITAGPKHTDDQIDYLLNALVDLFGKYGLLTSQTHGVVENNNYYNREQGDVSQPNSPQQHESAHPLMVS
eukprot:m.76519 g.76519  ORF g.76519 m.76519 type:complete len:599 (-) comp11885_c0_seq1:125-1921(-)